MAEQERRSGIDRRSGVDRRQMRPLKLKNTYFLERRQSNLVDRRSGIEIRSDWTRISKWSSAYIGIEVTDAAIEL